MSPIKKQRPSFEDALSRIRILTGHTFQKNDLLREALTIYSTKIADERWLMEGNKRLAEVGDAVLKLAYWHAWFTDTNDYRGPSQVTFSALSSDQTLNTLGRAKALDKFVLLGNGLTSVGDKQMATTVKAILGAVWLDSDRDMKVVKRAINGMPDQSLKTEDPKPPS